MDIQTNIIDERFSLNVCVGEGANYYKVPLLNFVNGTYEIRNKVLITEHQNIIVELVTSDPMLQVELIWENILLMDEESNYEPCVLTSSTPQSVVYKCGEGKDYPWRCGNYQYEVRIDSRSYFGSYQISPKNVSEEGLQYIHELINEHVQGLMHDYTASKRNGGDDTELEQIVYWQYFTWYKKYEKQLLSAISYIENDHEQSLREIYIVETQPRRQTLRSIQWAHSSRGVIYKNTHYLNRRMEPEDDTAVNQIVKWRLQQMLLQMQQAMTSLRGVYASYEFVQDRLSHEVTELKERLIQIEKQKTVARQDKDNLLTTLKIKQSDKLKFDGRIRSLQQLEEQYTKHQVSLQKVIQSSFWSRVKSRLSKKFTAGSNWGYKAIDRIWLESKEWRSKPRDFNKHAVPVMRPTPVLYEYYVFFKTIETLMDIGYCIIEDSIYSKIDKLVTLEGLEEGAYVLLSKNFSHIKVTYDELIESHATSAKQKNTNFYSSEVKRKPDVRLDHYESTGKYVSSIILEVKYRPFQNIYNEMGNTEAMIQMGKYWAIGYVDKNGRYTRNPIKQVVCIYPGDEQKNVIEEAQQGLFLQLYPESNQETIGGKELLLIIDDWLK
ncbi:hypothetical protein [Paenibacillus sp. V4I5]|uniref:hypothetical protein n=1 Tax=Paenibacillus sp. V4I5 TaxID=3042306 RepID=UPI00278D763B|nr:hypothetical protein [Paenibacillus sp. V4I5]MDQ0917559.1 hypothetical protein [Paenibacillus sp. V4I5]